MFLMRVQFFFFFPEKNCQIEAWNRNIAWLTPTGIQFPNGPWVSGMEISSSLGLKNLKISPWVGKAYLPWAYGPWEESFSSRGLIIGGWICHILSTLNYLTHRISVILFLDIKVFHRSFAPIVYLVSCNESACHQKSISIALPLFMLNQSLHLFLTPNYLSLNFEY